MPRIELLKSGTEGRPSIWRTGSATSSLEEEAIHQIARAYQAHAGRLCLVRRPIGNFLFLGPTGSGKTRMVEATAESLLQNSQAVTKIDCAEFQHSHEIAKFTGSPVRHTWVTANRNRQGTDCGSLRKYRTDRPVRL